MAVDARRAKVHFISGRHFKPLEISEPSLSELDLILNRVRFNGQDF